MTRSGSNGWSRDGGIHEIPLPDVAPGRLWLCGKHVVAPDPDGLLARQGGDTVICLNEERELAGRYPDYVAWLRRETSSGRAIWHPMHDLGTSPWPEFRDLVDGLTDRLRAGRSLIVHCGAGIGRAGTTAVGVLLRLGMDLDEAAQTVRQHRPMAGPEAGTQTDALRRLAGT